MTRIGSGDKPELQGGGSNQEIFESDHDSVAGTFAFNAPGHPRSLHVHRMNWYVPNKLIHKRLPPLALQIVFRSLDSVNKLDDADHGQAHLDFTVDGVKLF
jgi:hypothetical protein